MIDFAGWQMPVSYRGIIEEHHAVRRESGIFDLSHMGEFAVGGSEALEVLQELLTNDVAKLEPGQAQYTLLCNPEGGIIDDIIVYRRPEDYLLVVNAANRERDWEWITEINDGRAEMADLTEDIALIAVQGPLSMEICQKLTPLSLGNLAPFTHVEGEMDGIQCLISHTGYTGEKGLEIYLPAGEAVRLWDRLLEVGGDSLEPVGLGARDTLRLEKGFPLYGNDIDSSTTPLEAGLGWVVKWDKGHFIGKEALLKQREEGVERKLCGLLMLERAIPRQGYKVFFGEEEVGVITSGTMSPTLGKPIAMAYLAPPAWEKGQEVTVMVRNKTYGAQVVGRSFV
jgi:aminomethyltransferase